MKKYVAALVVALITALASHSQPLAHPWQDKTVAYFGDSITDPRNKASGDKYWSQLQKMLGITPYVYAVSGREWNDIPRQTDQLLQEHGHDFDAILIFIGTNDYNNAVPLGRWYDEKMETAVYGHGYEKRPEARLRRIPSMDADTYRGRINIALDSLKRTFPEKQIVLLTPIHRAGFYANDKNWQVPEDYANRCGEFLDAYVEAVVEAGRIWSVPVIDLNALCGLYPLHDEHGRYFHNPETDRLHPNDAGHSRMAQTLYWQLLTLPCTF
ncbi:MAG: SGNH/GDSL hydrolase family protein [Muribaculaceae bacterium]|nr:SGNH/GDSL hydrolase family protein [Muribaculaceae bacterium]